MSDERHHALQHVIEAISDETPVDWATEMRMHPELSPLLESARDIESLMRVFRAEAVAEAVVETPGTNGGAVAIGEADGPPVAVMDSVTETAVSPRAGAAADAARPVGERPTADGHPTRWGHLERLEWIAGGGFGDVYRAYDPMLDRDVALKLWRERANGPDADIRELLSEARKLARVRHPNVLVVHGADRHAGRAGMWTDLLAGETLEARLEKHGVFGAREATAIGIDLCRALAAVHAEGMMHRDIKTFNVMRTDKGQIVLMDFGSVGDLTASGMLKTSTLRGTPLTMAPEHLRGERIGPTADLYSVGVLLYHLVTGAYPVEADSFVELGRKHMSGEIVPLRDRRPDLPHRFVRVVERAMSPSAADRYASAGAMERALVEALEERAEPSEHVDVEVVEDHAGRSWWAQPRARFVPAMAALLKNPISRGVAAVLLVAGLGLSLGQPAWRPAQPPPDVVSTEPEREDGATQPPQVPSGERGLASRSGEQAAGGGTPLAIPPVVPQPPALSVAADLYRETPDGDERLLPGARVRVGDVLWLEIEGNRSMYVYVFNEDQEGEAFALFPNPLYATTNPLAPGVKHRLPRAVDGSEAGWPITSVGGKETIIAIASSERQEEIERLVAELKKPRPRLRGMSEVIPSIHSLRPVLDRLPTAAADPWIWRIELDNPKPQDGSGVP